MRILYRPYKKLLSTFFVIIAFLIAFSESWSQDIIPKYNNCATYPDTNDICTANFERKTDVMDYNYCKVEVTYVIKQCVMSNGFKYFKMEVESFRVFQTPACNVLMDNLLYPDGNINDVEVRKMFLTFTEILSDKFFKPIADTLNTSIKNSFYACNGSLSPMTQFPIMQSLQGTCMAFCKTKGNSEFVAQNPFGFVPAPNVYYNWENFQSLKCSDNCCLVYITYCFNVTSNEWIRKTWSGLNTGNNTCDSSTFPTTPCQFPPRLNQGTSVIVAGERPNYLAWDSVFYSPCEPACTFSGETTEHYVIKTVVLGW